MACVNIGVSKAAPFPGSWAGYMSISDYQLAQRSDKDAAQVKEDERAFARSFLDMQKEAKRPDITQWTSLLTKVGSPSGRKSSQIMKAHEMGWRSKSTSTTCTPGVGQEQCIRWPRMRIMAANRENADSTICISRTSCSPQDTTPQGYASLEGDIVHGFEKGFLRFDATLSCTITTTLTLAEGCHESAAVHFWTEPQLVPLLRGGGDEAGCIEDQSVVRNEPGQAISDEVRIIQTVTPISAFRPPPLKYYVAYRSKRMETAIEELRASNLDRMMCETLLRNCTSRASWTSMRRAG